MIRRNKLFLNLFLILSIVFLAGVATADTQTLEGDIYTIKIDAKNGVATVTVTPKTVDKVSHHCNIEFPWKLQITKAEGVTTDKEKYTAPFKKADGTTSSPFDTKEFGLQKVVFEVKYTAAASKKIEGKLTFSICDDKQCYRKTHQIEWI